jgi:molybdenum cofactor biosynthesis enzyme MoaA
MFKRITDKKDYIRDINVQDYNLNSIENKIKVTLFDKILLLENDPWMWHLHLKLTDICNAKCYFCIESGNKTKENPDLYIDKLSTILSEMYYKNILYSVSLTGGEPLLFKKFDRLVDTLNNYPIQFLTMNTNGSYLKDNIQLIDGNLNFVNISRHSIKDDINKNIFKTEVPTIEELKEIKSKLNYTKMRLQYVITDEFTYNDFLEYIDKFSFVDDLSFRRLMSTSKIHNVNYNSEDSKNSYREILDNVYKDFNLVEQVLQDYYVYETWERNGKQVTFSYSNMNLLTREEEKENESICREFILHPNGVFSGSWDYNKKIIF